MDVLNIVQYLIILYLWIFNYRSIPENTLNHIGNSEFYLHSLCGFTSYSNFIGWVLFFAFMCFCIWFCYLKVLNSTEPCELKIIFCMHLCLLSGFRMCLSISLTFCTFWYLQAPSLMICHFIPIIKHFCTCLHPILISLFSLPNLFVYHSVW